MKPIFIGKAYKFTVQITVNDAAVDISGDVVKAVLSNQRGTKVEYTADTISQGNTGTAIFDLTDSQTNTLTEGFYDLEVIWQLDASRSYIVNKKTIEVINPL